MRPSHRKHNRSWPRMRFLREPVTAVSAAKILREVYPQFNSPEMARPWSFKLAYDRHWITSKAYYATRPVPTGRRNPGITELMYQRSSIFSRLRKDVSW